MLLIFSVNIFKSADSVPNNLFSFYVPSDLFTSEDSPKVVNKIVNWQQAALTLNLSYFCMGDLLTAVNKRHWMSHTTYDNKLKEVHELT